MKPNIVEGLVGGIQAAPEFKVQIDVGVNDEKGKKVLFEPYSIRWEQDTVIIEAEEVNENLETLSSL